MHILQPIPATKGLTETKMLWVLLVIGVIFAEKLDRTYLPPPGSVFSGGSPGAIQVPLEVSKTIYKPKDEVEGLNEVTEFVAGINRIGPKQVDDAFDDLSFTKIPSSDSKQSSRFNILDNNSIASPENSSKIDDNVKHSTNSNIPQIFQPLQSMFKLKQYEPINLTQRISSFGKQNHVYLPPYNRDNNKNVDIASSTTSPLVGNENYLINEYKHTLPYTGNNDDTPLINSFDKSYDPILILSPNHSKDFNSDISSYTPLSTSNRTNSMNNHESVKTQPERIQAKSDRLATIINYDETITPGEGYNYNYDTSNGIHADETGTTTNGVRAKGSYSYTGDDGNTYQVIYTADENGFKPNGAHLPTSPPIPDAILKVIEQAEKEREAGVYHDGYYDEEKYGYKLYQEKHHRQNNQINDDELSRDKNKLNPKPGHKYYKHDDSQVQNGLGKQLKDNKNVNVDIAKYNNHNQEIISPNKHYHYNLSHPEENKLSMDNFMYSQEINDALRDNINQSKGRYESPTVGLTDLYKNDVIANTGYQYIKPQNALYDTMDLKSFPSRFSGDKNGFVENPEYKQEIISRKGPAIPFLTPYVSRIDDDDLDNLTENPIENGFSDTNGHDLEHMPFVKGTKPANSQSNSAGGHFEFQENISGMPEMQKYYEDTAQHTNEFVPSHENGYHSENFKSETNKQSIFDPNAFHTTSDLPSLIDSTQKNNFDSYNPSKIMPKYKSQLSNTNTYDTSSTKMLGEKTDPISLVNDLVSDYPLINDNLKNATAKNAQFSRPELTKNNVELGIPYKASTATTVYPDIYNKQTTTAYSIGEDFSGPKH